MRIRDYLSYQKAIHKRALKDTQRFALKHVRAEFAVTIAAAIAAGFLHWWANPQGQRLVEAIGVALLGGLVTAAVLGLVYYAWNLSMAPARLHVEQEGELAKHVPVETPKSHKGLEDFIHDIEQDLTSKRLIKATEAINSETRSMISSVKKYNATLKQKEGATFTWRRRQSIRLGKRLQASARRMRRKHKKYEAAAEDFDEIFVGASSYYSVTHPRLGGLVASLRATTEDFVSSLGQTRRKMMRLLSGRQEEIEIAIEQLDAVLGDIETTAKDLEKSLDKIVKIFGARVGEENHVDA